MAKLWQTKMFSGLESYREKWLQGLVLLEADKQRLIGFLV